MRRPFLSLALMVGGVYALAATSSWWTWSILTPGPVTYTYPDGTSQVAMYGPQAPWPDWAPVPDGTRFSVRAWLGPAVGRPSSGYGEVGYTGEARDRADAYARQLEAQGWTTEVYAFRAGVPGPIGPYVVTCTVEATRKGSSEVIRASFEMAPNAGTGKVHWTTAMQPGWELQKGARC